MRVLFCSQAAHTGGGVETWMESLSSGLERQGVEVVTALAKGRYHDPERYSRRHRVVNPIVLDGTLGFRETRIAAIVDAINHVQPDIVIPVLLEDAMLATAYVKSRGVTCRLAVCVHSQAHDRVEQLQKVAPFIDLAVGVSRRIVSGIATCVDADRTLHIPVGAPAPLSAPTLRTAIKRVAYIGRLDQAEKRVGDLITLARLRPDLEVQVAGAGPEESALRSSLPSATFHGPMTRLELYERIYPVIDAVLIFSPAEAGPMVAWEASVHGVIPIVSDYVGRQEEGVLRHGETAIVFPVGDVRAASSLLGSVDAETLSRNAMQIDAMYREPAFHARWVEALEGCMNMRQRVAPPGSLPPLASPGRMAKFGLPVEMMARLRRVRRRAWDHGDPGSEWPH